MLQPICRVAVNSPVSPPLAFAGRLCAKDEPDLLKLQRTVAPTADFLEAVTSRQTASFCNEGIDRQRILELLDSEIDDFNDLIAVQWTMNL